MDFLFKSSGAGFWKKKQTVCDIESRPKTASQSHPNNCQHILCHTRCFYFLTLVRNGQFQKMTKHLCDAFSEMTQSDII